VEILDPVNFDQPAEIAGFKVVSNRNASIEELLGNRVRSHEGRS